MLTRATQQCIGYIISTKSKTCCFDHEQYNRLGTELNERNQTYVFCIKYVGDLFRFINRKNKTESNEKPQSAHKKAEFQINFKIL